MIFKIVSESIFSPFFGKITIIHVTPAPYLLSSFRNSLGGLAQLFWAAQQIEEKDSPPTQRQPTKTLSKGF